MLDVPKSTVLAAARELGIEWREDASNAETEHDRNWLRHEVLPLLEERRPGLRRTLARTAAQFSDLAGYVEREAAAWLDAEAAPDGGIDAARFRALDPALAAQVARLLWERAHGHVEDFDHHVLRALRAALRRDGARWSVPFGPGLRLEAEGGALRPVPDEPPCGAAPGGPGPR
jgi:hypothetical protein